MATNYDGPRTHTLSAGTIAGQGMLLTNNSTNNNLKATAAKTDLVKAVSAEESQRDQDGLVAAGTVSAYAPGKVLMVASKASATYTYGAFVYNNGDGYSSASSASSATVVGVYVGNGVTTGSADGDLIPVGTWCCATA